MGTKIVIVIGALGVIAWAIWQMATSNPLGIMLALEKVRDVGLAWNIASPVFIPFLIGAVAGALGLGALLKG